MGVMNDEERIADRMTRRKYETILEPSPPFQSSLRLRVS